MVSTGVQQCAMIGIGRSEKDRLPAKQPHRHSPFPGPFIPIDHKGYAIASFTSGNISKDGVGRIMPLESLPKLL